MVLVLVAWTGTVGSLSAAAGGATVPERNSPLDTGRASVQESSMRTRRIVRSLVVAGTAAALSILSIVSTVMAVTGGGDFPRLR